MKKNIIITIFTVLSCTFSFAQNKNVKFAISPSVNLPTGILGQITSVGLGGEVMGLVEISPKAQLFGQLGFQSFIGKNMGFGFGDLFDIYDLLDFGDFPVNTKYPNVSNINFIVGARTNVNNLILGAGMGFGHFSVSGFSQTGFALSPQIGYAGKKVDVIYHWTNSFATLGSLGNTGIKVYFKL